MDACPRAGETVYLHVGQSDPILRPFVVRHVTWYPESDAQGKKRDFQAYIILGKNRVNN